MIKKSGAVLITKTQVIVTDFTFTEPHEEDADLTALRWAASRIAYEIETLEDHEALQEK